MGKTREIDKVRPQIASLLAVATVLWALIYSQGGGALDKTIPTWIYRRYTNVQGLPHSAPENMHSSEHVLVGKFLGLPRCLCCSISNQRRSTIHNRGERRD